MRDNIIICFVVLSSFCVFGPAEASAQKHETNSFLRSLSFEWYGAGIYGGYYGYSTGGRLGIAVVEVPMVNRIFSQRPDASDDLLLLGGLKIGSAHETAYAYNDAVQLLAPELALHYPLVKIFQFGIYGGPAVELTYTNNSKRYLLVPSLGIDLGVQCAITRNFSAALESRWIMTTKTDKIVNVANFPRERYAYVGIALHFSLPWQSQEKSYELARSEYDRDRAAFRAADSEVKKKSRENDSLVSANSVLKSEAERLTAKKTIVPAPKTEDLETYNPALRAADPEYLFTRDPFKNGNLVNDTYLKNVLIDIIDEAYVWQISARSARQADAEKIRNFFTFYNSSLGRRIAVAPDESVRTFKLTCLGKVTGTAAGTKRK